MAIGSGALGSGSGSGSEGDEAEGRSEARKVSVRDSRRRKGRRKRREAILVGWFGCSSVFTLSCVCVCVCVFVCFCYVTSYDGFLSACGDFFKFACVLLLKSAVCVRQRVEKLRKRWDDAT